MKPFVCAIIITFNPQISTLQESLLIIKKQVDKVIIVDNNSDINTVSALKNIITQYPDDFLLIELNNNIGIASAQNVGIKAASNYPYSHILFLDHDSTPEINMVANLLTAESSLLAKGISVGAVGPTLIDKRTKSRSGFVKRKLIFISRILPSDKRPHIETDFLISSGTLVRQKIIQSVGYMEDSYFIDHVDTEWCFRLITAGYKLFGVGNAYLKHHLGEKVTKIWFGRWREIPRHNNFRYYYIFRNTISMTTRKPIPLAWRVTHLYRLFIFFIIFGCSSLERFKIILSGTYDGIFNKMGKYNPKN